MDPLSSSRFSMGVASLTVGIAVTSLSRALSGFLSGLLLGAGIVLILTSAVVMGRSTRDGDGWLPRRDGHAPPERHGSGREDER